MSANDTTRAAGAFDVKILPQQPAPSSEAAGVGRMLLDKRFHGDLDGPSRGEMLAARTEASGSAAYVALERVEGTLHGRRGTFVLAHLGTMTPAGQQLTLVVVPGSGTDELAGLAGSMKIVIAGGKHSYELDYTLPAER
jgi:hypothetical protein